MDPDTNSLAAGAGFIEGDLYSGLVIVQLGNQVFDFKIGTVPVRVYMKTVESAPGHMDVVFNFQPEEPVRFRVDLLLPPDCINACVTLNELRLISWFSDQIPEFPGFTLPPACDDGSETVSTLSPGQFQSLNFLWMRGDELVFHLYF